MNRLGETRKAMGMRQAELAQAAEVAQSTLSRMEDGDVNLTGTNLVKVAQALNVSADYLLGLADDPRPVREGPPITLTEWALLLAVRAGDTKRAVRLVLEQTPE